MASSRGAQGQIPLFDAATMKLHFAMGGGNGTGGVPPESSFDPSSSMPDLHRGLPPPPPTESGNQFVGGPPLPPPTPNQVPTGVFPTAPSFLNDVRVYLIEKYAIPVQGHINNAIWKF